MPSMFEPGGIVQQEFFVAGTPVIAFKTGGLKDTVVEFDKVSKRGNGFTFEAHTPGDFMFAMQVRVCVWEFVQQHAWTPAAAQGPCSHAVPSHPSAVCAAPPNCRVQRPRAVRQAPLKRVRLRHGSVSGRTRVVSSLLPHLAGWPWFCTTFGCDPLELLRGMTYGV